MQEFFCNRKKNTKKLMIKNLEKYSRKLALKIIF